MLRTVKFVWRDLFVLLQPSVSLSLFQNKKFEKGKKNTQKNKTGPGFWRWVGERQRGNKGLSEVKEHAEQV